MYCIYHKITSSVKTWSIFFLFKSPVTVLLLLFLHEGDNSLNVCSAWNYKSSASRGSFLNYVAQFSLHWCFCDIIHYWSDRHWTYHEGRTLYEFTVNFSSGTRKAYNADVNVSHFCIRNYNEEFLGHGNSQKGIFSVK